MRQLQHNKFSESLYELSDEEIYDLIKEGSKKSFPIDFWQGIDGKKRACNIIKHLVNNIFNWTFEDVVTNYKPKLLFKNKLGKMVNILYDGDEIEALKEAFPELKKREDNILFILKESVINNEKILTRKEILQQATNEEIRFFFQSITNLQNILKTKYSREELLNILKMKKEKLKRVPSCEDMKVPQAIIFIREFDEFDNALKEAGLI